MKWLRSSWWKWWWRYRLTRSGQLALMSFATIMLFALGVGGYLFAQRLVPPEQTALYTEQSVTVTRTVIVKGKPKVIREIRTRTLPVETQQVTVRRNGKTVVLTRTLPGETVLHTRTVKVKGPVRQSVVTKNRLVTVPRDRLVRVTLPGKTLPGTTVQGPERVVTTTLPERVVTSPAQTVTNESTRTVTLPPQTVTNTSTVTGPTSTVTGPTQTVTGPTTTVTGPTTTVTGPTQTVTHTVTQTETVTVTVKEQP